MPLNWPRASRPIPALLEQARDNLADSNAADLWMAGDRSFRGQVANLTALAQRVSGTSAALDRAIADARDASAQFRLWLAGEAASKTGPSGIGKDNYTWYLQNVHLVPYSWEQQVTLMRRELARAHASLRLEENRKPPPARARAHRLSRAVRPSIERVGDRIHEVSEGRGGADDRTVDGSRFARRERGFCAG